MIENPDCLACGRCDWERLGERVYRAHQADQRHARQLEILFAVWAPGTTEFRATFLGCKSCGMMVYSPRPTAADIDAKYRYSPGSAANVPSRTERPRRTNQRIRRLESFLSPYLPQPPKQCRILDFGGGDGRLLKGYAEQGAACDLIDYVPIPVAGVRHVGSNENDLPNEPTYDGIVCSHVVEHMAEPHTILTRLRSALKPDGAIYVDVPMEISRELPARSEPVTHCNFFIPESLATLLERSGYRVETCELTAYPHPDENWKLCATAVAKVAGTNDHAKRDGFGSLNAYLNPDIRMRLHKTKLQWRNIPRRQIRRLRSLLLRFR